MKLSPLSSVQIGAFHGVLQPTLGFRSFSLRFVEFVYKYSFILSAAPRLGDLGGNRARRPADLIGERIGLFLRKFFAGMENFHRGINCDFVHVQLPMIFDQYHDFDSHPLTCSPTHLLPSSPAYPARSSAIPRQSLSLLRSTLRSPPLFPRCELRALPFSSVPYLRRPQ